MKKTSIAIMSAVLILSLSIAGIVTYINGGSKLLNNIKRLDVLENNNILKEQSIAIKNISKLKVDTSFGDISITHNDGDNIDVKIQGEGEFDESKYDFNIDEKSDELNIEVKEKNKTRILNLSNDGLTINISLPKEYINDLNLQTSLGNIELENVKLKNLQCNNDLGNIRLKSVEAENTDIKASKGDIELDGFTGNLVADSDLGNIDVDYAKFNNKVDITNSSGDVKLGLPKESQFYIDAEKSLGECNIEFPMMMNKTDNKDNIKGFVGDSNNKIKIKTSLGNISVLKNN